MPLEILTFYRYLHLEVDLLGDKRVATQYDATWAIFFASSLLFLIMWFWREYMRENIRFYITVERFTDCSWQKSTERSTGLRHLKIFKSRFDRATLVRNSLQTIRNSYQFQDKILFIILCCIIWKIFKEVDTYLKCIFKKKQVYRNMRSTHKIINRNLSFIFISTNVD